MTLLSRRELYDLVWSKPVKTVSAELGLSDVGLKKACARANIPVPERGYWAKLAAGKKVFQASLPPRPPGTSETAFGQTTKPFRWPPDPEAELAEPAPREPVFDEPVAEVEKRVRTAVGKVSMIRTLAEAHPQIRRVLTKDEARREKYLASGYSWDAPAYDSPFEQRRFKVLNTLFLALTRAGARPSLSGQASRTIYVGVGSQNISVSLDHPKATRDRWDSEKVHGGKADALQLEIAALKDEDGRVYRWQDSDAQSLEIQLTEVAVMVITAGEIQYRRGALHTYRYELQRREEMRVELARQREEAARKERERLAELERQRRERLLGYARDWRAANDIRAFIATVQESARSGSPDKLRAWMEWADAVADRLDPFTEMAFLDSELN